MKAKAKNYLPRATPSKEDLAMYARAWAVANTNRDVALIFQRFCEDLATYYKEQAKPQRTIAAKVKVRRRR